MDYYMKGLINRILFLVVLTLFYPFYYPVLGSLTLYGSVFLLRLFQYEVIINASNLHFIIGNAQFNIIEACVAVFAYFLLFILILTTKDIEPRERVAMFLVGFIIIYIANVLRIFGLTLVFLELGSAVFEQYHYLIWNFVSGIFVALVWIFLVIKFKVKEIPIYSDVKALYNESLLKKR